MKNLFLQSSILLFATALAYSSDITVSDSGGNWSSASAWSDSVLPSASDTVIFSSTSGTLNVDSDYSVFAIKFASSTNNITIGDATLSLSANTTSNPPLTASNTSAWQTSILNISGTSENSKLAFTSNGETFIQRGIYNLNVATSIVRMGAKNGVININYADSDFSDDNYSFYSGQNYSGAEYSTLNISTGASAYFKGAFANWGKGAVVTVEEGGYLEIKGGGLRAKNTFMTDLYQDDGNTVNVAGTLIVQGVTGSSNTAVGNNISMYVVHLNVESSGVLELNGAADAYISNSMTNYGKITVKQNLYLSDKSKITLGKGSDIRTNGASSQSETYLYVAMNETLGGSTNLRPVIISGQNGIASVSLILESDQALGGFKFAGGSSMDLTLNGNQLSLESIEMLTAGSLLITINDFDNGLFRIKEKDTLSLDFVRAYAEIDGEQVYLSDLEYMLNDDGYYYLYSGMVPEPSTVAAVLGVFALAFAAYRRRK